MEHFIYMVDTVEMHLLQLYTVQIRQNFCTFAPVLLLTCVRINTIFPHRWDALLRIQYSFTLITISSARSRSDILTFAAGILEQSVGARNRVGRGLSPARARLLRLAGRYDNSVPTRFLPTQIVIKFQHLLRIYIRAKVRIMDSDLVRDPNLCIDR